MTMKAARHIGVPAQHTLTAARRWQTSRGRLFETQGDPGFGAEPSR